MDKPETKEPPKVADRRPMDEGKKIVPWTPVDGLPPKPAQTYTPM
jgi:hypothetical protein